MFVKTWSNRNVLKSGTGYGIRIGRANALKFFNQEWTEAILEVEDKQVIISLNPTFWTTCSELRSKYIGQFLIKKGLDTWDKGSPNRLILLPLEENYFKLITDDRVKLATWAGLSKFYYTGNIEIGTIIYFGKNNHIEVSSKDYKKLLNDFYKMKVEIGTSRDKASEESLGYWLQNNITKTAIASYVGKILIHEKYAFRDENYIVFR